MKKTAWDMSRELMIKVTVLNRELVIIEEEHVNKAIDWCNENNVTCRIRTVKTF
ncbi:MAG: hypothetical protein ACRC6U_09100 [Fusobacteriaceae bacterium]